MPTTLSAISNTLVTVRWRQPYVSEGLNKKLQAVLPSGVYRGLNLSTSASNLTITLQPDATAGDHVAVFEGAGFSMTYADGSSGIISLSLASFAADAVVVVALYVNYTVGGETSADFRGFTLAEYEGLSTSVRNALVVLGTVTRPATAIPIPTANITHNRRKIPFMHRTDESTPWNPLLRDTGFELGHTNATYRHASPYWKTSVSNANFSVRPVTTEARSGSKSLEITTSVAGAVTATIQQDIMMPVTPGRFVMTRLFKKAIQAATSSPSGTVRFVFGDSTGANVLEDVTFAVDAVDASFKEFTAIAAVPATARMLKRVQLLVTGTYAAASPCIRFDDVQAWAEGDGANWLDVRASRAAEEAVGDLFVGASELVGDASAKVSFDGTTLALDRRDEDLTKLPPVISIQARTTGSIEYTPVFQSLPAGTFGYRKYVTSTGRMVDVVNASYDNTTNLWTKDVPGQPAYKQEARETGFSSFSMIADTAWADAAWSEHFKSTRPEAPTVANQSFAPLLEVRDSGGNRRSIIDHNGFMLGRATRYQEIWSTPSALPVGWAVDSSGTSGAGAAPFARFAQAQTGTSTGYACLYSPGIFPSPAGNYAIVSEWELTPPQLKYDECKFIAGFASGIVTNNPDVTSGYFIGARSTDVNWQLVSIPVGVLGEVWTVAAARGQIEDTGVPVAVALSGVIRRIRFEAYGTHASFGGRRILLYIDGALVAQVTDVSKITSYGGPGDGLTWVMHVDAVTNSDGSNRALTVGPIVVVDNREILADDAI